MPKLTVLIPCKDEGHNIVACVESVRAVADEILVADSGSTDGTQDLVRRAGGCRLIQREFISYADFKNWAIPQAAHEWVLVVDADERVTPELTAEIHGLLTRQPSLDAYALRRQNFFLGQPIHHCGWNHSYITRLLRKGVCSYKLCRVHEEIDLPENRIGRLAAKLLHYTCTDFESFVHKQVRYSFLSADDRHERGARTSLLRMLLHGPLRFLQLYVLRGGFLDGSAGLVLSMTMAYYAFLKDAKLWSLSAADDAGKALDLTGKGSRARKAA